MSGNIIIVDDDRDYLLVLGRHMASLGYGDIVLEDDSLKAAELFTRQNTIDLALIDMTMPHLDGMALLDHIKNNNPGTECIMITAINEAKTAVECLRKGAYDYLVKPVARDVLALSVGRALERKRLLDILNLDKGTALPRLMNTEAFAPIITRSKTVIRTLKEAELHAASDVPVLITGESGTGKELLARAIHSASPRAGNPFTPINMASLSGNLFEAEFFGHTKGAFTGAESERIGYLEHTHRGTLFLDEIGDLSLSLQGKLLRVLQDGEFTRLGTSRSQKVDLRFIAATNEDLDRMMANKIFRKDLYYRIRGGWLHLPPLRERSEDIPLLIKKFLEKYRDGATGSAMGSDALDALMKYTYPGNVRELKSIIQSAANLAGGERIGLAHLPEHLRRNRRNNRIPEMVSDNDAMLPLAEVERAHILKTYKQLKGNKSHTARVLGIGLNTLRRKLAAYQIS